MKQMNLNMFMNLMMFMLVMIMILVSVAFLTLMERKVLSYIQIRKGPNKVSLMGLLQPFSDALKLLSKEFILIKKSNFMLYYLSPVISLMLILMMWLIYPFLYKYMVMMGGLMYLMCCFSLGVYSLLLSGWSSNSSYSMMGSLRSLAQSISYEVSLSLILIIPMFLIDSMDFNNLFFYQDIYFMFYMWPIGLMFFFSIMAELNRTPFDFSEGESELVSGFNIEYGSVGFTMIFLSEYGSILFLSFFFNLIYLGSNYMSLFFYLKMMILIFFIIWIRGCLPRFRYDLLMYLCWLMILPLSLNYMFYMIIFKIYIYK